MTSPLELLKRARPKNLDTLDLQVQLIGAGKVVAERPLANPTTSYGTDNLKLQGDSMTFDFSNQTVKVDKVVLTGRIKIGSFDFHDTWEITQGPWLVNDTTFTVTWSPKGILTVG